MRRAAIITLVLCLLAFAPAAPPPLVTVARARFLFGTICTTQVTAGGASAEQATEAAFAALRQAEARFSNYQPESEVTRLNRLGSGTWPVSKALATLLRTGLALRDASGGLFDLGVWPLMALWQRCAAEDRLPTAEEIAQARAAGDTGRLHLDETTSAVRLEAPGCPVDVSALVKGYAMDRAVEALRAAGVMRAVVNAGGQVFALAEAGSPVPVEVVDPRHAERVVARLAVANRSVATSSQSENGWTIQGRRYGHLLDPRTGWPRAPRCVSATVVAPAGAAADGYATVAALLGPEEGRRFIAAHPGAEALWLVAGPRRGALRAITTPGWAAATHVQWLDGSIAR